MQRACFLDRDGVIIALRGDGLSVRTADEVRLEDGAAGAIARLRAAGLLAIVVTNQPGPVLGLYTHESVVAATARMHALLAAAGTAVDDVLICLHGPDDGCDCRKPRPGMLLAAAARHGIDLAGSFMIGDNDTDVAAGEAAGCRSFRVGTRELPSLAAAVDEILR
jgi:D-glycero-D-manno-heptose 1,7-bisphosphate phosphatase